MIVELMRHRFNVEEYHRMGQAGIFLEDDRVELVEGEIIEMTPIGSRHAACVNRLTQLFSRQTQEQVIVHVQNPIRLGKHSEPQPDLALLKHRQDYYAESHPKPSDVLLVVEVADTSLSYDQQVKILLYAQADIPEVWLVDIVGECIEIHREPSPQGYEQVHKFRSGEKILSQAISFSVDAVDILGS